MMVTGSNNEAAALVGVGSHSQRSFQALPHWTDSNTPVLLSSSSTPICAVKTKKIAQDNYTIKALFTVIIITHNISAYNRIKSTFLSINEQYVCMQQGMSAIRIWSIITLQLLILLSKNILDSTMHSYIINNFMKADLNTQHQGGCGTAFLKFHETRNFDENILNFAKFCEIW